MDRSQMFGLIIIAGTMVEMLVFLFGIIRRSYLALAIPMLAALTAVNLLAVWVGWTMLTTEPELPEELAFEEEMAEE